MVSAALRNVSLGQPVSLLYYFRRVTREVSLDDLKNRSRVLQGLVAKRRGLYERCHQRFERWPTEYRQVSICRHAYIQSKNHCWPSSEESRHGPGVQARNFLALFASAANSNPGEFCLRTSTTDGHLEQSTLADLLRIVIARRSAPASMRHKWQTERKSAKSRRRIAPQGAILSAKAQDACTLRVR